MTGLLFELEQHRLRGHGHGTLQTTRALCDELLSLRISPGVVHAMLATFAEDVTQAAQSERADAG